MNAHTGIQSGFDSAACRGGLTGWCPAMPLLEAGLDDFRNDTGQALHHPDHCAACGTHQMGAILDLARRMQRSCGTCDAVSVYPP